MNKKKEVLITQILPCLAKGLFFQALCLLCIFKAVKAQANIKNSSR